MGFASMGRIQHEVKVQVVLVRWLERYKYVQGEVTQPLVHSEIKFRKPPILALHYETCKLGVGGGRMMTCSHGGDKKHQSRGDGNV